MIVVGYYTKDSIYEKEAKRFKKSLARCKMVCDLSPIEFNPGYDWYDATSIKPTIILAAIKRYQEPILYVDVDAIMHANCNKYFKGLEKNYDFAAHWFQGPAKGHDRTKNDNRFLSGTMWFNNTSASVQLLETWEAMNQTLKTFGVREGGGQKNLWYLLTCFKKLRVFKLPGRYCYIFDKKWAYPPNETPIIEHLLASRENRGKNKFDKSRQQRIQELEQIYR